MEDKRLTRHPLWDSNIARYGILPFILATHDQLESIADELTYQFSLMPINAFAIGGEDDTLYLWSSDISNVWESRVKDVLDTMGYAGTYSSIDNNIVVIHDIHRINKN